MMGFRFSSTLYNEA